MSLLWVEGWDNISNTTGAGSNGDLEEYLKRYYTHNVPVGAGPQAWDGRLAGSAFTFGNDSDAEDNWFDIDFEPSAEVVLGFAFKPGEFIGSIEDTFIQFYDTDLAGDTLQIEVGIYAGSSLTVKRGGTTLLGDVVFDSMRQDRWNFIEVKYKPLNTSGLVEIRINETVVYTFNGDTNEAGESVDRIRIQGVETPIGTDDIYINKWDDMYVLNTTGATNNDYLGVIKVEGILPDGVGSDSDFTPSAGANWQNVNEVPQDGDTSYNESGTVGHLDLFAVGDVSIVAGDVFAVKVNTELRATEAQAMSVAPKVKSGTTEGTGTSTGVASTTEYVGIQSMFETNPDTVSAWTVSDIQSMNIGYEVT